MLRLLRWRCMGGLDMGMALRRCMGMGTTAGMRSRMATAMAMDGGISTTAAAMTGVDGGTAMATDADGVGMTIVGGAAAMTTADGAAGNTGRYEVREAAREGGLAVFFGGRF